MMQLEQGTVLRVLSERRGIRELAVMVGDREEKAIQFTDLSAPVAPGQTVSLNTTAVRLGLGTGGYHFVLPVESVPQNSGKLESAEIPRRNGHIMKLRYTPGQIRVHSCEEPDHPAHALLRDRDSIDNLVVIAAELHSMLPALAATVTFVSRGDLVPRIAYVMTDGASLPIAFSRTVAELKEKGLICGTVTVGHAFGGDLEAVNLYSGLLAAKHALHADLAIVAMGPGIVGTASKFGHSGIEQGQVINAVASLGGISVVCPRISFADPRPRHRGISHHTLTALGTVALANSIVPFPILELCEMEVIIRQIREYRLDLKHDLRFLDGSVVEQASSHYNIRLSTMGRTLSEDRAFFLAAGAAGIYAAKLLEGSICDREGDNEKNVSFSAPSSDIACPGKPAK